MPRSLPKPRAAAKTPARKTSRRRCEKRPKLAGLDVPLSFRAALEVLNAAAPEHPREKKVLERSNSAKGKNIVLERPQKGGGSSSEDLPDVEIQGDALDLDRAIGRSPTAPIPRGHEPIDPSLRIGERRLDLLGRDPIEHRDLDRSLPRWKSRDDQPNAAELLLIAVAGERGEASHHDPIEAIAIRLADELDALARSLGADEDSGVGTALRYHAARARTLAELIGVTRLADAHG